MQSIFGTDGIRGVFNKDITYSTNSELGFDYLRDNMKFSKETMVQREHNYAIVDEIDSCLIDEARTPLIISGATEDKTNQYIAVDKLVKNLKEEDFEFNQDIDFDSDSEIRSPGWIRYQKKLK